MQRSIGSRSGMPLRPLRWPHGWSLLRAARFSEPLALRHQEARRGAVPWTCFACLWASGVLATRACRAQRRQLRTAMFAVASPVMDRRRSAPILSPRRKAATAGSARPYRDVDLPIQQILPSVLEHCKSTSADLVLQAPTGAGKTTVVPLALLDGGMVDGKVIVLQPRRITCISVARRMAELWGESIGETIGYRIRHEAIVSNRTRIEVVTEGVLLRLLGQNPDLEGIGCICFDEFHERSIESDLAFALCLHLKRQRRLAARLVIMSATFGTLAEQVSGLLGNARTIISEGRCFPVQVLYTGALRLTDWEPQGPRRFADLVATQVKSAMEEHEGDVLVFVPGEREIMYVWIALNNMGVGDGERPKNLVPWAHRLIDDSKVDLSKKIQVSPLYGTMETHEQDSVLKAREGWRKVILATPIAESSLTVPSVRIVVDTGLRRVKVVNPDTTLSCMKTVPVSLAAAEQRRGRAGRVAEGVCYRLWSEEEHEGLDRTDAPELHREDLATPVLALALAGHGTNQEINSLPWVDAPRLEPVDKARKLLKRLQVLASKPGGVWEITPRGKLVSNLPVHPRIGHMVLQAQGVSDSFARDACDLAAVLEEKDLLRGGRQMHGVNLEARMLALQDTSTTSGVLHSVRERVLKASAQLQGLAQLRKVEAGKSQRDWERQSLSILLSWAFPELLAEAVPPKEDAPRQRGRPYKLHCGSEVFLDKQDPLAEQERLIVASATGGKVFWAMAADVKLLEDYGIDVNAPLEHKVLSTPEETARLSMPEVRRYLIGKQCDVKSEQELIKYMGSHPEDFPPRDVTDLIWDIAMTEGPSSLLSELVHKIVLWRSSEFAVAELVEVACALANGGVSEEAAFDELADAILPNLQALPCDDSSGNLASLLWAFSEAGIVHRELFQALAERGAKAMAGFQPKVLSDAREPCFWSFHRASASAWSSRGRERRERRRASGFACRDFYDLLAPLLLQRMPEIHPICCVYLMWSFCKPRVMCQDLFDAVAARVIPEVQSLDRCGLAMFSWNYSYINYELKEVYKVSAAEALRTERLEELTPRDLANLMGAFAKAGIRDLDLMQALSEHGCGLLRDGIDQKCYKRPMKSLAREIYEEDFSAVDGQVDAFDMVSLSEMLGSFADQQFLHQDFLELADEYMMKGFDQPKRDVETFLRFPQVFARALVSRARAYIDERGRTVFQMAMPHVVNSLAKLQAKDVLRLTVAWAMLGLRDPYVLAAFESRLLELDDWKIEESDLEAARWALKDLELNRQLLHRLEGRS